MKFVNGTYSISPDYASYMQSRAEAFKVLTGTGKSIHLTMVTSDGVEHNEGWQSIQSEVMLDDLFSHEE